MYGGPCDLKFGIAYLLIYKNLNKKYSVDYVVYLFDSIMLIIPFHFSAVCTMYISVPWAYWYYFDSSEPIKWFFVIGNSGGISYFASIEAKNGQPIEQIHLLNLNLRDWKMGYTTYLHAYWPREQNALTQINGKMEFPIRYA